MITTRQQAALKASGQIESYKNEIRLISDSLERVSVWRPSTSLKKQCEEALQIIVDLENRLEKKMVVTLIGPCGSGKSTLLNALSGVDELSASGRRRPTTRNLVVLAQEKGEANQFLEKMSAEDVEIRTNRASKPLEHVLLIDTPDTDSTEQEKHIPMVQQAIELSDVLICVFNAENPKRKDTADFLAPYVNLFKGESLICVLNRCDRLLETELKQEILPEFSAYINEAWDREVASILCISARRHLNQPGWDEKALPRHDFDQYPELEKLVFGTFKDAGYVIDRRLENAMSLRDHVVEELNREVDRDRGHVLSALTAIRDAEKRAIKESLSALSSDRSGQVLGINVLLYQKLAQKWIGPVGWIIAIWARILIFGTGMLAMFRFGNPVSQLAGVVSSIWRFKDSRAAVAETGRSKKVDAALRNYRMSLMKSWPEIGEALIRGRFDPGVRKIESVLPDKQTLGEELTAIWNDALDASIEKYSAGLSGLMIQFLFNIPVVGILVYIGWLTTRNFFSGNYLHGDFFLHAFLTVAIVLFLCFFIFQGLVRLFAGTDRIAARAFETVKKETEQLQPFSMNPITEQAGALIELKTAYEE